MLSSLVDHVSSPQPPLLHPLVPASSTISASAIAGLTLFLVFAVAFLLSALYSYLLPKPITGIPYNPEAVRCLLGDAPAMMRDERGPMDWLLDQGRRHSGPICQLFLRPFSKPFVLISDFREAQDIMLRRKEWDRSDYSIELLGGQAPYHHINQKTGPVWKAHRRLLQDLMMPAFLHRVAAPNIYASTLDLVKLWTDKERLAHGRPFSAENDIFYASLDSVLEFSFGSAFPHRAIPPQMDLVESHLRLHQQRPTPTTPHLPTTCQGAVEFASAPVHDTIEATLHASIAMGDLMDSPFPRLSWWFKSKMPYQAWAIRTRNRYLKEQVTRAVQRMSDNETDLKNETWVRSAVDLMMLRERMFANKEGRRPIYWSPSIRDEVSIAAFPVTQPFCLFIWYFVSMCVIDPKSDIGCRSSDSSSPVTTLLVPPCSGASNFSQTARPPRTSSETLYRPPTAAPWTRDVCHPPRRSHASTSPTWRP